MPTPSTDVLSLVGTDTYSRWNLGEALGTGVVVTYSFPTAMASYDTVSGSTFQAIGAAHQTHIRAALEVWSQASGVTFVEVPDTVNGEIRFSMFDMTSTGFAGFAYYPSYTYSVWGDDSTYAVRYQTVGGDVFLNSVFYNANPNSLVVGADGFSVVLHEVGHALGFEHPFSGNIITPGHDNSTYTIMSYNRSFGQSTLGTVDIEAVQYLYGADNGFVGVWDAVNSAISITGTGMGDWMRGTNLADILNGNAGNDTLLGGLGDDTLFGGDGADTLNGGIGDDVIIGGDTAADLRDVVYGGDGHDSIDGGYGNDELRGDAGNDNMAGGFGADTVIGGDGQDVITGSAWGDEIFGGAGNDFLNGGFGHDRVNGGTGADKFYHLGILDHGSDWIQDYNAADGDVLLFGNATATAADFQINYAHTADGAGERSGDDNVQEAFVIYRHTGQIMWALVDGAGQAEINIQIAGVVTDLLV